MPSFFTFSCFDCSSLRFLSKWGDQESEVFAWFFYSLSFRDFSGPQHYLTRLSFDCFSLIAFWRTLSTERTKTELTFSFSLSSNWCEDTFSTFGSNYYCDSLEDGTWSLKSRESASDVLDWTDLTLVNLTFMVSFSPKVRYNFTTSSFRPNFGPSWSSDSSDVYPIHDT